MRIIAAPNRFVIFRDIHSGLEYIRSTEEIRDKGLYFELDAYAYKVLIDFHEVEDNGEGQYRHLPFTSMVGAYPASMKLSGINARSGTHPIRELINAQNLHNIFNARVTDPKIKLNPEILHVQSEKFRYLIQSVNGFVNGHQTP